MTGAHSTPAFESVSASEQPYEDLVHAQNILMKEKLDRAREQKGCEREREAQEAESKAKRLRTVLKLAALSSAPPKLTRSLNLTRTKSVTPDQPDRVLAFKSSARVASSSMYDSGPSIPNTILYVPNPDYFASSWPIAMVPKEPSPLPYLQKLPTEIRLRIYRFLGLRQKIQSLVITDMQRRVPAAPSIASQLIKCRHQFILENGAIKVYGYNNEGGSMEREKVDVAILRNLMLANSSFI